MIGYIILYFIIFGAAVLLKKKVISLKISKNVLIKIGIVLCFANTITLCMEVNRTFSAGSTASRKVERDEYGGSTKTEEYLVQVEGETEKIEVQISPRIYKEEEVKTLFSEVEAELDKAVLGGNKSFEHVDKNLNLPSKVENFPFRISWELSRYDVIDFSGKLVEEEILEKDPENEGITVKVTGTLRYEEWEQIYEKEILLFSERRTETRNDAIRNLVEASDEKNRQEKYLILPDAWEGRSLSWTKVEEENGSYFLIFGVIISVLLIFDEKEKEAKRRKERKEELLSDYPEIISQFTMLMGAGMTAKNVWKKIAIDYKQQKERTGRVRAAYEEILYTWQEMQSGIPEAECYERFSRRCEVLPYMKMGALLTQNLKKGSKGLADMLMLEAVEAMEERKNRAKRLGEEAGTKLLAPMLLMLVIVLAIVVVPAFWAANF